MKTKLLFIILLISFLSEAQNVNIPDANFKFSLVGNSLYLSKLPTGVYFIGISDKNGNEFLRKKVIKN